LQGGRHALTTLDASLQTRVQDILDARLKKLSGKHVANAGALVIDHTNGDILAWVVAGARDETTKAGDIDTVTTARQPGSTLKPFLYATALEKGWTAATILNDAPIAEAVGSGLHRFRNYSNTHYGPITLREALGNSLNIPAVLTINYVGVDPFLNELHRLGFDSLDRGAAVYDEGLALGNGEVTLFELTRAYATLANRGTYRPLRVFMDERTKAQSSIFKPETASLIGNILSDPRARSLEFGSDSILNLPVRTAAKTGTSTDYRDAWTLAYNDRYTVGIWMGNLDRTPMKEVTGSTGPSLAMRSIFQILNTNRDTQSLYVSPALIERDICTRPSADPLDCPRRTELFAGGETPEDISLTAAPARAELVRPTNGLMMAYDPRVPAERQKFRFELAGLNDGERAEWVLDDVSLGVTESPRYLWPLAKGRHKLGVIIYGRDSQPVRRIDPVAFTVR
jgi:penicillin-binding protein 1C